MANCSIPNSTPAIGRTLTPLSRRSRRQNSAACILERAGAPWLLGFFNAQHPTPINREQALNAQRSIQTVGRWMLGVQRWAFSFWRVKGAWWSSRSSKPLSVPHTRDRGRFDSYPLRLCKFDGRCLRFDFEFTLARFQIKHQTSNIKHLGRR